MNLKTKVIIHNFSNDNLQTKEDLVDEQVKLKKYENKFDIKPVDNEFMPVI